MRNTSEMDKQEDMAESPRSGPSQGRHMLWFPGEDDLRPSKKTALVMVICLAVLLFCVEFGYALSKVPEVRLLEDIICREQSHTYVDMKSVFGYKPLNELLCKSAAVQSELNTVSVGITIAGSIPGLLVAFLFGSLADSWGRRPVYALCIAGMVLADLWSLAVYWTWTSGSIRLVWTSSIAFFIGGGRCVAESVIFAIISDISTETTLATHFQIVISGVMLADTLAPIAANAIMQHSLWLPLIISPCLASFASLFMFFFPETVHIRQTAKADRDNNGSGTDNERTPWKQLSCQGKVQYIKNELKTTAGLYRQRPVALMAPAAGLSIPIATVALSFSLRYIAIRFRWTLGGTGVMLGLRTGFCILILVCVVPLTAYAMRRWWRGGRDGMNRNNLLLAQIAAALAIVGLTILAAAPIVAVAVLGLFVFTLSSALPSLCRAVMSDLTSHSHVARLFASLAFVEIAGIMVFSIVSGVLFNRGLVEFERSPQHQTIQAHAASYLALPFYFAALLSLIIAIPLLLVRLPRTADSVKRDHSNDLDSHERTGQSNEAKEFIAV